MYVYISLDIVSNVLVATRNDDDIIGGIENGLKILLDIREYS
jgi:hypothetical protein